MQPVFIPRAFEADFLNSILPQKVLIILGARRVGKTQFIRRLLEEKFTGDYMLFNGDDQSTIDAFSERKIENFRRLFGTRELIVIDEAQKIPDIGQKLKLIVDEMAHIKVIATGSSLFDLSNKLGEPLVGREKTFYLFPLSQSELNFYEDPIQTKNKLEERLIFGSYPELEQVSDWKDKAEYLNGIVNSYLLRDILEMDGIRKSDKLMDLLRLIALQIGKEVHNDELANNLKGISRNTVDQYLDLLSKVFVIYRVGGYNRNLRKEITKSSKWYFYDNGIRNAILRNFNRIDFRTDKGELWENYLMSERIKRNHYRRNFINSYFWRTYDQQEIDLVEESGNSLNAFEFKWSAEAKVRVPGAWNKAYPEATFSVIHSGNYLPFITE
ncbi:MAG TPA: ATP-binding protein [Flavobacteriales bacterium]|nr:ATP-binding protein [Flavobacteriales bacterium]HRJ34746.1 ATP-binding protein [Flavobacteriales bacterium]HRJ40219.1 ATP-binding protein [Flavobacteriales bacterium]